MYYPGTNLARWQRLGALVACVGAGAGVAILWQDPHRLWPAYLFAFLVCWLLCIGGMGLVALGNLTGGRWAAVARPFYLAAAKTLPLVAIMFVPIGVFADRIYPWTQVSVSEQFSAGKAAYLETQFFCVRAVVYFVVWLVLAWLLGMASKFELAPASTAAMRRVGAISLVLLVPTSTFAAFDWAMSLEPFWYSSIYGALLSAAGVLAAHSLAISGLAALGDRGAEALLRLAGTAEFATDDDQLHGGGQQALAMQYSASPGAQLADVYNDLGSLLLAFLMVTTYFALSQFLIIWSGNLPSEITWYLRRLNGGWQWLALLLVLMYFVVPFSLLLSRERKRSLRSLRRIALLLLATYFAYLYWHIVPAFGVAAMSSHILNLAALALLLGSWLAAFAWIACRGLVHCESLE